MYLDSDNVTLLLNTGTEVTATHLVENQAFLHLGVGEQAYMEREDAIALLTEEEYAEALAADSGLNLHYIHLPHATLLRLVSDETFYLGTDRED